MKRAFLAVAILFAALYTHGQTAPPTFEVASIKPSADEQGNSNVHTEKGRMTMQNVTLKRCVRSAYGLPEPQILGGPKWFDEDRFNIEAKAASPAGDHELSVMLQALLAERFKLVFHRETRSLSGYALLVAKGGLKAKASAPDAGARTNTSRTSIEAQASTLSDLAQKLAALVHAPVADLTGIEGAFDFKVEWAPDDMQAKPPSAGTAAPAAPLGPSLFAALPEQLGLRLEARKVPAPILVVDSAQKPSEN